MDKTLLISDQINGDYREYALYVIQSRGIPNFYDALTPVQRIILQNSPEKYDKTLSLIGNVIKSGLYHHGDMSLANAISKLAKPFGCYSKILEGDGFFGSPVNPNPSAPRYTSVRISKWVKDAIYKHYDLNEKNKEGGFDFLNVEFPIGLVTHIIGIAVGYKTNILPRKTEDVIEYLEGKNKTLKPSFIDFSGRVYKDKKEKNKWIITGDVQLDKKNKSIKIFDIPPIIKYESFMQKLVERLEKLDINYKMENFSKKKCEVHIKLNKLSDDKIKEVLKEIEKISTISVKEDITFIKDNSIIEFNSIHEYLDLFKINLENIRTKRINQDIINFNLELDFLQAKLNFLNFMISKKRTDKEIKEKITSFNNKIIGNKLSQILITRLSEDEIKETQKKIKDIKKLIIEYKKNLKLQEKKYSDIKKKYKNNNKEISLITI